MSLLQFIMTLGSAVTSGTPPDEDSDWILSSGSWDDSKHWIDEEHWID